MKAIVFGGSGFIGSHVADELSSRGHKVRIFDMKPSPYLREGQEMVVGDIFDADAVKKAMSGCEVAYNFAGLADLDSATTMPVDTIKNNILGNACILNACVDAKVKRFVYASSIYVYSSLGGFYRCSKQSSELYVEEYNRKYGLDFTILRYGTVYGPRSDDRNSIHRYLKQALATGKIVCESNGEEIREYVHVADAARLSVDILSEEFKNQHVIITGHHPIRFVDMLNTIKEMLGNKVAIELKPPSRNPDHYNITPYSFAPKLGRKLVSNYYTDLGQGLLECMEEISKKPAKK
jgi:UDP-glucose 4-epimerase